MKTHYKLIAIIATLFIVSAYVIHIAPILFFAPQKVQASSRAFLTTAQILNKSYNPATASLDVTSAPVSGTSRSVSLTTDTIFNLVFNPDTETLNVGYVPADIDHNLLKNYTSTQHFTQAEITHVSPSLGTGVLMVTNGTGALSIMPTPTPTPTPTNTPTPTVTPTPTNTPTPFPTPYPVVTTLGDPGSDANLPTEQASREAITAAIPVGTIWETALRTAPAGWLLLGDGAAVSRSTYASLFAAIVPSLGTFTVSQASPAVITLNGHGLSIGDTFFATTTGALYTGMTADTLYYVITAGYSANSFEFSASPEGAAVNTSGSQSGTHTLYACPYGLGNGSTTFNLPKRAGRVGVGAGVASGLTTRIMGSIGGEEGHSLTSAENGTHSHTGTTTANQLTSAVMAASGSNYGVNNATGSITINSSGSGTAHNTMQPYIIVNYMIKY